MRQSYWEGRRADSRCRLPPSGGRWERKVRSPQGSMPANGRADAFTNAFDGKRHRKHTARRMFRLVRVKRCGKSAPRPERSGWQGKPHAEQDQIGEEERPALFDSRVGRWSRSAMGGLEE